MYNANYMEGVPVKIAEKYKPPPEVYKLPQPLVNKLNLDDHFYENSPNYVYDLQLERKALAKIDEWKQIRQRNNDARRERKAKRELQRQEDEKRQRNLLMRVSYPNADDLSSSGSDEETDRLGGTVEVKESTNVGDNFQEICVTKSTNSFHNILQPTVLPHNSTLSNDSVTNSLNCLMKSNQSMTFNYKDFEDDTSSPFDNIELKTINDLDVLAQVLHNTQLKSTPDNGHEDGTSESNRAEDSNATNKDEGVEVLSEHEYVQPEMYHGENIPKHINLPKFSYDLGNLNSAQEAQSKLSDYSAALQRFHNSQASPAALSSHAFIGLEQSQQQQLQYLGYGNIHYNNVQPNPVSYSNILTSVNPTISDVNSDVTKWKSVPDILKELRDEIRNSELRRTRNCSHNLENNYPIQGN